MDRQYDKNQYHNQPADYKANFPSDWLIIISKGDLIFDRLSWKRMTSPSTNVHNECIMMNLSRQLLEFLINL